VILSLELQNFRRHQALTINFTTGLNTLKGANEQGKSTVIEGVLYALYGAKALRDTLAETVTWGEKESSLVSKLVIKVRDTMYSFKRSKSGAECRGDDGVVVTGQGEVTAYAAELLGADAKIASLLMMASQSGLRGALDDGPAAVSSLMAKLADFDVLDKIMESATQKLSLGSTVPMVEKLAAAEADLVSARLTVPDEGTVVTAQAALDMVSTMIVTHEALERDVLQPAIVAADQAVGAAEKNNADIAALGSQVTNLQRSLVAEDEKRKAAIADIVKAPGNAVLTSLRNLLADETNHAAALAKHQSFGRLKYPAEFWEGDEGSFLVALEADRVSLSTQRDLIADQQTQIRTLTGRLITNGKCPTCGHASQSDEHVAAHNGDIQAEIATLKAPLAAWNEKGLASTVRDMEAVQTAAQAYYRGVAVFGDMVKMDTSFYPAKAAWIATVPAAVAGTQAAAKLREAEALQRAADVAQGRHDAAVQQALTLEKQIQTVSAQAAQLSVVDIEPLKAAHDTAYQVYAENSNKLRIWRDEKTTHTNTISAHQALVQLVALRISSATSRIAELQADIRTTEFNNVLVGKLKKIKPAITDHLWGTVLAAVGVFFSQMRGEQSVVTKDKDGFKVNGKSVESLSGSTMDVLALAVRVALTKTFIPHASFITLDEPAHGCDTDRTSSVLGFLAGVGFQQTILASHDELSEAVSDNVIALGV